MSRALGRWTAGLLWLLVVLGPLHAGSADPPLQPDQVNLALRRAADRLLRASGDSSTRIPAVEQRSDVVWRVRLDPSFEYDSLPPILEASLVHYGIDRPYRVAIRRCDNAMLDLGYHRKDLLADSTVSCMGRDEPEGCHYLEVEFLSADTGPSFGAGIGIVLILLAGAGGWWWYRRSTHEEPVEGQDREGEWITLGRSRLHPTAQMLECGGMRQTLTYREAKLLRLFAEHPNEVLERDVILQQVWGEEGVQVGRSVDMFVSRLRKKLRDDPSLSIVAVHGLGYRLENVPGL